ncbi:MAG TPA: hypothetical protein VMR52_09675 [Dehalococcoidia bacterium]|nr:hypothetical protein [Dehalococcoidia bacterium]
MRYAKHEEETSVSCGRCEAAVCPKCMVHTDVGVRCNNCAPDGGKPLYSMGKVRAIMAGAVILLVVIGGVGTAGDKLGISGSEGDGYYDYYDDHDDYEDLVEDYWDVTESVGQVVDPWVPPEDGIEPADGHRFVAIELTIESETGSEVPYYLVGELFKITDTNGFAYEAVEDGARPVIPAVNLDPGEKARGWITFEVAEEAEIASLSDLYTVIDLPD